jgi:hypothetical protein
MSRHPSQSQNHSLAIRRAMPRLLGHHLFDRPKFRGGRKRACPSYGVFEGAARCHWGRYETECCQDWNVGE